MTTFYPKTETKYRKCGVLMLVDDSVMEKLNYNYSALRQKLDFYMRELNKIFRSTVLSKPPHNMVFMTIQYVKHMRYFLPGCSNGDVGTIDDTYCKFFNCCSSS